MMICSVCKKKDGNRKHGERCYNIIYGTLCNGTYQDIGKLLNANKKKFKRQLSTYIDIGIYEKLVKMASEKGLKVNDLLHFAIRKTYKV